MTDSIKLKVDATGSGHYQTVAGLRASVMSFNGETIHATTQESVSAWRDLLCAAGLKFVEMKGHGIFKDAMSDATVRDYFFNGTIANWQIIIPSFGTVQGLFQISALDLSGEVMFDMSIKSAGALTFVAT
jgi:TP901-1 family phage major tail protein